MLIKIPNFDDETVSHLMKLTASGTGAGAVRSAAQQFPDIRLALFRSSAEVEQLKMEVNRLTSIIEGARASAALLLEKTSQTDIFQGESV
jgi:hypothetical protein